MRPADGGHCRLGMAGAFEQHVRIDAGVGERCRRDVDDADGPEAAGKVQPDCVHVGDDDLAGAER